MIEAKIKRITGNVIYENYLDDGNDIAYLKVELGDAKMIKAFESLCDKELANYKIEVKRIPKEKSDDMNRYMWQLCSKIADVKWRREKVSYTKNDIYRTAVKEVGVSSDFICTNESVKRFCETWGVIDGKKHIGYFTEIISQGIEHTMVRCYYGSSSYNSEELRRLTDWVVEAAEFENIETATPADLNRLENLWRKDMG